MSASQSARNGDSITIGPDEAAPGNRFGRSMARIQPVLTHSLHLGSRVYAQAGLRYLVALAILVGTFVASRIVGVENLDVTGLVALGLGLAAYNTFIVLIVRPHRQPRQAARAQAFLNTVLHTTIVLDYLALAAAVWLVGGSRSPFLAFFVLHLVNCILLSRRAALASAAFGYAILAALILAEYGGILPTRVPVGAVADPAVLDGRYSATVLAVYGMLFVLTSTLLIGFSELLRRGEQRLHQANQELERLVAFRRDFLHIALHNVQSPVGAVTMLLQNMRDGLGGPVTEQQQQWLDRSMIRLGELTSFVRDLRLLGSLDADPLAAGTAELDVAALLEEVATAHRDAASQQGHDLQLDLPETLPAVRGVQRLIREAVVNYVTNAIKYTPQGGRIVLRARAIPPDLRIEVEDNGVGVSPADQAKLFQEFVRIKRPGSAAAKVPGDGLGLSIVRRVVEAHGGSVGVESEPGEGSRFYLLLPAQRSTKEAAGAAAGAGRD